MIQLCIICLIGSVPLHEKREYMSPHKSQSSICYYNYVYHQIYVKPSADHVYSLQFSNSHISTVK